MPCQRYGGYLVLDPASVVEIGGCIAKSHDDISGVLRDRNSARLVIVLTLALFGVWYWIIMLNFHSIHEVILREWTAGIVVNWINCDSLETKSTLQSSVNKV